MRQLALATDYTPEVFQRSPSWWWSEKLDGWRAYWDGTPLYTRHGHELHPPKQWLKGLPSTAALDGELYVGRGQLSALSGILQSRKAGKAHEWRRVRFCVFDMPRVRCGYPARYAKLGQLVARVRQRQPRTPLRLVTQTPVTTDDPYHIAATIIGRGGEGIVLRDVHTKAQYVPGRSSGMLKLKATADAEATVVEVDRQGPRLKALVVVSSDGGATFRLGSGFTNEQRRNPAFGRVGDTVTYKYNGTTSNGKPRSAVYLRHRHDATRK